MHTISKITTSVKKPLNQLKLDPHNVRFKHEDRILSDKEIEDRIWKENDTKDLYRSVLATCGIEEPLYIDSDDVVREGNRRLVVLRKLSEKAHKKELGDLPEDTFDIVDCQQLPSDIEQMDINVFFATVHVSGRKEWDAINKAAHIFDMHERDGLSYDKIREYIGGTKATLIRYVKAYQATKDYLAKYKSDRVGIRRFSYFDELFKKPALRQWLNDDTDAMNNFIEWLSTDKFRQSNQVRRLPDVLMNDEALKTLKTGNMDEALRILADYDPTLDSRTFKLVDNTIEALRDMPRHELLELSKKKNKQRLLQMLHDEVEDILGGL